MVAKMIKRIQVHAETPECKSCYLDVDRAADVSGRNNAMVFQAALWPSTLRSRLPATISELPLRRISRTRTSSNLLQDCKVFLTWILLS